MSDAPGTPSTPAPATATPTGPRPEPLRFFGTTWVEHDGGYAVRRLGAAVGSLAAAAAGCVVLRFACQGLAIADIGSSATLLVVVMFALCGVLSFRRVWAGFRERPDPDVQAPPRGMLVIGFVGVLFAYFVRSLAEAPGEGLHRREYETACEEYTRRMSRRTGNPAKRRRGK